MNKKDSEYQRKCVEILSKFSKSFELNAFDQLLPFFLDLINTKEEEQDEEQMNKPLRLLTIAASYQCIGNSFPNDRTNQGFIFFFFF